MAAFSISALCGLRHCLLLTAVVVCALYCLPGTATALPMKGGLAQAVVVAKMEQQQQQQQQQDHHRQKRAAIKTNCAQPDNLEAMFQQINSQLSSVQFLKNLHDGKAISHPGSADPVEVEMSGVNKTCPSSLSGQLLSGPVAERSLCPFYFSLLMLPEGYYPSSLKTAHCKCQRCVQHAALGCEPVSTPVAVLKPVGCFQGMQKYQEEHILVNTACTCASGGDVHTTTAAPTTTTTSHWGVE